jgi:hypothetical protein
MFLIDFVDKHKAVSPAENDSEEVTNMKLIHKFVKKIKVY